MDGTDGVIVGEARSAVGRAWPGRTDGEEPPSPVEPSRPGTTGTNEAELKRSAIGRALINFGLIVTLAAIFVVNMPNSVVKSRLVVPAQPYLTAIGLGQNWGVFAPSPRTQVIYATGHIRYSDGTTSEWSFPVRTGLMAYSDYRWQKFEEHVRLDKNKHLWPPFAAYLAQHESTPGRVPVQVSFMRRWADLQPPGRTPTLGPWRQFVYYTAPAGGVK